MLELAPELRINTVTSYLANVDRMLSQGRFAGSRVATGLRQQIREFSSACAS
jgi:hypothetical protein